MTKPVILTGLRANNDLTIGNYFGAILPMIDMVKTKSADYQINMFIPDLHSFTTPIDHSQLYDQILHNARLFVAAGLPLDNDGIHLYRQSYIPAHSEMTWILDCFTGFGEMSRMTQFKDKSGSIGADRTSVGLFNYPVLMAADILLYNAKYVPVGDDQSQHLEFARDIGMRINNRFGDMFTIPEAVKDQHEFFGKDQGLRIKDLVNPTKKMSKSDDTGKGVIFLGDDPQAAAKKIMSATTDDFAEVRFDRIERPGISNLLEILALLRGTKLSDVIAEFEGQTRYGDFKKVVADEVAAFLTDFQARLQNVDDATILRKLEQSEAAVGATAKETLLRVQQAVGLRPGSN
ncbi:MAG TPA: tryptophan--tRNA ligase [Candidatus Saccharimonadales bacterium]